MAHRCCYKYFLTALLLSVANYVDCILLKGVTIESEPFVTRINATHFEGYAIDLINEIARIAGFNYTLYEVPDGHYGMVYSDGKTNGMIREVFFRNADFAIADLTVTELRGRYVQFTEPFMTLDLSALVRKSIVGNTKSFSDLVNQTKISYGAIREGSTMRFLQESPDPTIRSMYLYILRNPGNAVMTRSEGINKVFTSNFAFLQESVANEFAIDRNCNLTIIDYEKEYYPREYAIALTKGSPHLKSFNDAIQTLRNSGRLNQLYAKYFKTQCNGSFGIHTQFTLIHTFSLILSALITFILFS